MTVELLILDCDGVLVDSERIAARVSSEAITALGWPLEPDEALVRFLGCSEDYFLAQIERELGRPLPPNWDVELAERVAQAFAAELCAVDGVVTALDKLCSMGVPTCVASNSGHDKLSLALQRVGLLERFAGRIFSADDVARGKPAPDLFLHAAVAMSVPADSCAVVEDSPRGVAAARAAGMQVFAYAGLTPAERLAGPDTVVFDRMELLPELISMRTDSCSAGCPR